MFVIVRHGNTFEAGEPARRIGARTDLPLTPAGVAQAEALGRHFAQQGWHFGRALVSPLRAPGRRLRPSWRISRPSAARPCEWLREIDHGPDEDRPEARSWRGSARRRWPRGTARDAAAGLDRGRARAPGRRF
jgi:probable phosphoglycerate mutase